MDVFRNVADVDFVCKLWFIFMRCYLKIFFNYSNCVYKHFFVSECP